MAFTSTGYESPATSREGLKPSVYDKIILIGADETPLLSKIGTSKVESTTHSWIIDQLREPAKNAQLEISDFVGANKSTKQKNTNACQILTTDVMVSYSMRKAATYGGKELAHQTAKAAKEHKRDLEYALFGLGRTNDVKTSIFKTYTARDDSTAGEMAGIFYYLTKGASSFTSGKRGNVLAYDSTGDWSGTATQLTETVLHEILQNVWDSGATPKDVFIGAKLKAAINALATRQFGNEKNVNSSVVSLDTDFGKVNFRLHRYLGEKYGLDDVLLAGDFSFAKVGLLEPTFLEDVKTSKTAIQKRYYTEATLEVRNADAFVAAVGLTA